MSLKNLFLFLILIPSMSLVLTGCSEYSQYDKGYEAGWEGNETPFNWGLNQQEIEGYKDGLEDSDVYDDGYYDGFNKKKPEYKDDDLYMEGYKDGKENA